MIFLGTSNESSADFSGLRLVQSLKACMRGHSAVLQVLTPTPIILSPSIILIEECWKKEFNIIFRAMFNPDLSTYASLN